MQNQIPSLQKEQSLFPFLWAVAVVGLCVLFILMPVPSADAQGNAQDSKQYTSTINQIFDFIQKRFVDEVDSKTLYEGAMNGMFNALGDPYSVYLSEREMTDLNDTTQGNFGGVGLYISKPLADKNGLPPFVEVASPIEDTPGWRAGINPGDLIIKIDGVSTDILSMDEVLAKLRGKPNTDVNVIIRRGKTLEFPVTLTRAIIEVPTTKHAMIGNIGYLKLLTFTPMTVERAKDAVNEFAAKGYKGLILDLRNNYGGLLNSAVGICDLFLDGGQVVSTKSRLAGENDVFSAQKGALVSPNIPVVVLINNSSASASEIVAGALKDRGRAYLVGEKSYGKGSVQQVFPLGKDGFKITVARYYTPSDVNIDKIGIPPDKEVKFPKFTEKDAEKLQQLVNEGKISAYIEANPSPSKQEITAFSAKLSAEYDLDAALLQRLVRNEQNRTNVAPVYDLEYDVQLQEVMKILQNSSYDSLMKTTKTLKQLQDEASDDDLPLAS
jgi:carboxyl-terminal processing protease